MAKGRQIFLEELPRWRFGKLKPNGEISWKDSIGYKVKFMYDNIEGEVKIVDFDGIYLYIKYKDKELFKITHGNFQKCQIGKLLKTFTNEFKVDVGQIFKDINRDLTITDRKYEEGKRGQNWKYYKYKCNKCGFYEGWIIEANLLNGRGCSCCSGRTVVEGINDIPTTDPWMVKLFANPNDAKKYTKSSNKKIKVICPDCGRVKEKDIKINAIYNNKSIGCSCGDGYSYGHKYMFSLLTQLSQKFIDNHTFDWGKFYNPFKEKEVSGEYDFVIEHNKLIIEVDGDFHRKDNAMNGQTKEESRFLDDKKDRLAIENGYNIIRISDEGKIKNNVTNSELSYLFNLGDIDWLKCEEFALKNRVREACELKRNNPDYTTKDIAIMMNMNRLTVTKYLKKGTVLGWCNYDPKEEQLKVSIISGTMKRKSVEIFKDNVSLGIFESATELKRQSKKLFGVKLLIPSISEVCNGKYKQYKGFTFKYV